jgi:hypothetical protein
MITTGQNAPGKMVARPMMEKYSAMADKANAVT